VFRKANIIDSSEPAKTTTGDITAVRSRRRASFTAPVVIRSIDPVAGASGLTEYDASGYNVIHRFGRTAAGELAELYFYRLDRKVNWESPEIQKEFPPDAIFSLGKWIKGEGLLPRR
jgi:hypothetical protein